MASWIITIRDHLKTQEMCNQEMRINPLSLEYVPDRFKAREICNEAVRNMPCMLLFVHIIKWHDVYKKRKAQKAQIKDELMSIAWHPLRWWDGCMSEDEKRRWK